MLNIEMKHRSFAVLVSWVCRWHSDDWLLHQNPTSSDPLVKICCLTTYSHHLPQCTTVSQYVYIMSGTGAWLLVQLMLDFWGTCKLSPTFRLIWCNVTGQPREGVIATSRRRDIAPYCSGDKRTSLNKLNLIRRPYTEPKTVLLSCLIDLQPWGLA